MLSMASGEDYVFRALKSGCGITLNDLKSGNVSLYDVARINESMDIEEENTRRAMESRKGK